MFLFSGNMNCEETVQSWGRCGDSGEKYNEGQYFLKVIKNCMVVQVFKQRPVILLVKVSLREVRRWKMKEVN